MIYRYEDPIADWDAYIGDVEEKAKREKAEEPKHPICSDCGCEITDEYMFQVNGQNYCEQCMNDNFGVYTDEVAV